MLTKTNRNITMQCSQRFLYICTPCRSCQSANSSSKQPILLMMMPTHPSPPSSPAARILSLFPAPL